MPLEGAVAIDTESCRANARIRSERVLGVFQHRVMGGSSSTEADRIGQDLEEETMTWTILLASISRWTRPMFAFSTAKAWSFARARRRRQCNRSRTNSRGRQVVAGSYSRPD